MRRVPEEVVSGTEKRSEWSERRADTARAACQLIDQTKERPEVSSAGRSGRATDGQSDVITDMIAILGQTKSSKLHLRLTELELVSAERNASFLTPL